MNREIKFRMWNNVEDKPECSRYFYDEYDVFECLKQQALFNKNLNDKLGYDHVGDGNSFEQFTGLKDKNGTEIYEGDIIKHKDHKGYDSDKWEVIFYSGAFWIAGLPRKIRIYNIGDRLNTCEVIGNIFENPELKTGF